MYPYLRFLADLSRARRAPPMAFDGEDSATHRIMPWDIDPWRELNNGRALTLYDTGRIAAFVRMDMARVVRARGWAFAVLGASVRYRRRVRLFDRYTLRTRLLGWDARFLYIEQGMWVKGACASHILIRAAVTSDRGIVPTAELLAALHRPPESPPLPGWVRAWIAAEAERPWPPMEEAAAGDPPVEARARAG